MIYSIVNTKGGVGKTTTAIHLATMLSKDGDTLLIDGDQQASSASWAAWRREKNYMPSPTTTCLIGKAILSEGKTLSQRFSNTVIDVGGRDSSALRSALLLSLMAIVPIGASQLDAAAMTDLLEVVEIAKDYNPTLKIYLLLTRVDQRTKDTSEMANFIKEQKLPLLKSKICERVAYRRAIGEGAIVHEISKDLNAINEMNALYEELQNETKT